MSHFKSFANVKKYYLEKLVSAETFLLVHRPVDVHGWEVLFLQKVGKGDAALNGFHENDDLYFNLTK